MAKAGICRQCF